MSKFRNKNEWIVFQSAFEPATIGTMVIDMQHPSFGVGRFVSTREGGWITANYPDSEYMLVRYTKKTNGRFFNGWGWMYKRITLEDSGFRADCNLRSLYGDFGCADAGKLMKAPIE